MDNSILIGKLIKRLLESNNDLSAIVGNKIFPLIADAKTTYPFIVYSRTDLLVEYSKGGLVENTINFSIVAVSNKYTESLEIANQIRNSLELIRYNDDEFCISQCRLESVSEEFYEDAYIQRLNFSVRVNNVKREIVVGD